MKYLVIAVAILLCSCSHRPEYPLLQNNALPACDSINITYYGNIQPILQQHCYECHASGVTTGGGLDLEDTASLKSYLKNGFRGDGVYGSKLYHCLLHTPLTQQMPPTYILDSCSLQKIHYWLSIGAPIN